MPAIGPTIVRHDLPGSSRAAEGRVARGGRRPPSRVERRRPEARRFVDALDAGGGPTRPRVAVRVGHDQSGEEPFAERSGKVPHGPEVGACPACPGLRLEGEHSIWRLDQEIDLRSTTCAIVARFGIEAQRADQLDRLGHHQGLEESPGRRPPATGQVTHHTQVGPEELRRLDQARHGAGGERLQQERLVGEAQVLKAVARGGRARAGVAGQVRISEHRARPQGRQTLEPMEGRKIAQADQVAEIPLQVRVMTGAQPVAALIRCEMKQRRHASPGRQMPGCHDGSIFAVGKEHGRSVLEDIDWARRRNQSREQRCVRFVAARGQLAQAQGPELIEQHPAGQGLAHLLQQDDLGRPKECREVHIAGVVGELQLLEDGRLLLGLIEDSPPHRGAPFTSGQRRQGCAVFHGIEVDVAQVRRGGARQGGLADLARARENCQATLVRRGQSLREKPLCR